MSTATNVPAVLADPTAASLNALHRDLRITAGTLAADAVTASTNSPAVAAAVQAAIDESHALGRAFARGADAFPEPSDARDVVVRAIVAVRAHRAGLEQVLASVDPAEARRQYDARVNARAAAQTVAA